MNDIGPHVKPEWWNLVRQVLIFVLGVTTIIYAIVTPGHDAAFLITGLVLIGFVHVDNFIESRKL